MSLRVVYWPAEGRERKPFRLQMSEPTAWGRMSEWARETHARNHLKRMCGEGAEYVKWVVED